MLVEELKHGPESLKLSLEQTSQIDRKLEKISELSYDELQEVFIKETWKCKKRQYGHLTELDLQLILFITL